MFTGFLFHLRGFGLKVSMMEWLALMRALSTGFSRSNLTVFYHLSRALLVKKEADFDTYVVNFLMRLHPLLCFAPPNRDERIFFHISQHTRNGNRAA